MAKNRSRNFRLSINYRELQNLCGVYSEGSYRVAYGGGGNGGDGVGAMMQSLGVYGF